MKGWRLFLPAVVLLALAFWPLMVSPMTQASTFWAFYLTVPLTVAAFIAVTAGVVAFFLQKSN